MLNECWVIKIGSALLTNDGAGLHLDGMADWAAQMAQLRQRGITVVLVSSGAIAAGMGRLGWDNRPHAVNELQAAAAVGQSRLVLAWEQAFAGQKLLLGQILLDADDLADRQRYLNARSTITTLLGHNVIPLINENDTVVTDEIRFGDNDTLAGQVANLVDADRLVLLTDQRGLYTEDPRLNSNASLIEQASVNNPSLQQAAGGSAGGLGRGGMQTKIRAAKLAARSGTMTYIASGRTPNVLTDFAAGKPTGTRILADQPRVLARKRWLGQLKPKGKLVLDNGAVRSLCEHGRSLLAVGVRASSGEFTRGDMVLCVADDGREIARGLVNFDASEISLLQGQPSSEQEQLLGYKGDDELIHRDNLVLSR